MLEAKRDGSAVSVEGRWVLVVVVVSEEQGTLIYSSIKT